MKTLIFLTLAAVDIFFAGGENYATFLIVAVLFLCNDDIVKAIKEKETK